MPAPRSSLRSSSSTKRLSVCVHLSGAVYCRVRRGQKGRGVYFPHRRRTETVKQQEMGKQQRYRLALRKIRLN